VSQPYAVQDCVFLGETDSTACPPNIGNDIYQQVVVIKNTRKQDTFSCDDGSVVDNLDLTFYEAYFMENAETYCPIPIDAIRLIVPGKTFGTESHFGYGAKFYCWTDPFFETIDDTWVWTDENWPDDLIISDFATTGPQDPYDFGTTHVAETDGYWAYLKAECCGFTSFDYATAGFCLGDCEQ
jgi:hypothetical protein